MMNGDFSPQDLCIVAISLLNDMRTERVFYYIMIMVTVTPLPHIIIVRMPMARETRH